MNSAPRLQTHNCRIIFVGAIKRAILKIHLSDRYVTPTNTPIQSNSSIDFRSGVFFVFRNNRYNACPEYSGNVIHVGAAMTATECNMDTYGAYFCGIPLYMIAVATSGIANASVDVNSKSDNDCVVLRGASVSI